MTVGQRRSVREITFIAIIAIILHQLSSYHDNKFT